MCLVRQTVSSITATTQRPFLYSLISVDVTVCFYTAFVHISSIGYLPFGFLKFSATLVNCQLNINRC